MKLKFTKMQGCGNDYIYFDCFDKPILNPGRLAKKLSDRHFGIGGDGIVLICPSEIADAKMRMFNADGSEGKMCGNAIRCVAKYLYENKYLKENGIKDSVKIETLSGVKTLELIMKNQKLEFVKVDMGKADFSPEACGVKCEDKAIINKKVIISDTQFNITCVSMGNPHCVIICENIENTDVKKIGTAFEKSQFFSDGVNTEFVCVVDKTTIKMRVWERGSGETLACGTGACAAVSALCKLGILEKETDITVKLLGGDLEIRYTDDKVYMTGESKIVFWGEVEYD